jgi:adenosylcobinamide-phosphate synthase
MTLALPAAASIRAIAVVVAFAVDHLVGEPPARWHPVVWMGRALSAIGAPWPRSTPRIAFARGAAAWVAGAACSAGVGWLAMAAIRHGIGTSSGVAVLTEALLIGLLLKPLLAWRMLHDEVALVERAVDRGLDSGRAQLRRLVSRDTTGLSATEVRESAIESLAENLNDSLVAPLLWFAVGGLPAAALYRFANTADAMWGYRGAWEWAGKWAARADDVLSYLPARLTALLIAVSAWAWPSQLRQVARVTASPNSGWPMGMLAIALNVRLSKPGVYVLNPEGAPVEARHVRYALGICSRGAWLSVALAAALALTVDAQACYFHACFPSCPQAVCALLGDARSSAQ